MRLQKVEAAVAVAVVMVPEAAAIMAAAIMRGAAALVAVVIILEAAAIAVVTSAAHTSAACMSVAGAMSVDEQPSGRNLPSTAIAPLLYRVFEPVDAAR
jgi:hypothetical protein